jgi:hypothetical protein
MGALTGKANGEEFTGKGTLAVGRRFGGGGDMRNAEPQKIA